MAKKIYLFIVIYSFFYIAGCKTETQKISRVLRDIYRNKVDLKELIGKNKKIVQLNIKQGYANCLVVDNQSEAQRSYFMSINLTTGKTQNVIENEFGKYYSMSFDIKGDSLFCISGLNPKKLYGIHLNKKTFREQLIKYDPPLSPGMLLAFSHYKLLTADVYGSTILKFNTDVPVVYENRPFTNKNAVSFPLSDNGNLICGQHYSKDSTNLIAIDKYGNEIWRKSILIHTPRYNSESIDLIRTKTKYVIRDGPELQALDISHGGKKWGNKYENYSYKAMEFGGNILLATINDDGYIPSSLNNKRTLLLKLINEKDGSEIWQSKVKIEGNLGITLNKNKILLFTYNSLHILDRNGKSIGLINCNNINTADMMYDPFSNQRYLTFDSVVYW